MYSTLNTGALGIKKQFSASIELAKLGGFEGIDIPMNEITSTNKVISMLERNNLKIGGWGIPVNIYGEESKYRENLKILSSYAAKGKSIGAVRACTFILPFSDEKPYKKNFSFHLERLKPVAEILKNYDCRLGLEFIGTKTFREGHKYEFIHTMNDMLELCYKIGTGNVGLLLDFWHWYTSRGRVEDLMGLTNNDVAYVHINDAPKHLPVDEQVDNVRCLPGETGVIDIVGFLKALKDINYQGPVSPEPFSSKLAKLSPENIVKLAGKSVAKCLSLVSTR